MINPPVIEPERYKFLVMEEFQRLLSDNASDEKAFQNFFEQNPCMLPGSRSEFDFGPSGHGPEHQALITQPKIRGIIKRQPDFMWLSYDSMTFCPVLIEIEAPAKKYYNRDGTVTKEFSKAKNQLDEWATVFHQTDYVSAFYSDFDICKDLRKSVFKPCYVLIYGRRSEYIHDQTLKNKRFTLVDKSSRQYLMSYDRIEPIFLNNSYVTCTVKDGKFFAKNISPTMTLGPMESQLLEIKKLVEAVDNMVYTTDERKVFLKKRIPYWVDKIKELNRKSAPFSSKDITKSE
jgi:hypothetical protein